MTGPLTEAADNTHLFCLNLIYASACSMTVQAWQLLEKAPKTPQNDSDLEFYLETLFSKPLEENV
tara:strand:+ start:1339 stop:1533 length:195 start_codon:yes stop_codon:yes gene_type:complete